MSLLRQLAGDTIVYGLGKISSKILNFVLITAYLTRVVSRDEYGLFSDMYFYVTVLVLLLSHRMDTALFRFGTAENDRERAFGSGYRSVLLVSIGFAVLLWVLAEPISRAMLYPEYRYVRYFSLILFFDAMNSLPFARLRLEGKARRFAFFQVLNVLLTVAAFLFFFELTPLWKDGSGYLSTLYRREWYLDYAIISNLVASGILFLILLPKISLIRRVYDSLLWKKMLCYAAPLVIVSVLGVVIRNVSVTLQKYWLPGSVEENMDWVGTYSACFKIAILLSLFTEAYNFAAEPFFFKQKQKSQDLKVYADATHAYAIVATLMVAFTLFCLPLLRHLIDRDYWPGLFVVPGLLYSFYLLGLYYNYSIWFKLQDKTNTGAKLAIIGAIITIALNLVLLPILGIIGAPISMITTYLVINGLCLWWGRNEFPVPYKLLRQFGYPLVVIGTYYLLESNFGDIGESSVAGMGLRIVALIFSALWLIALEWKFVRGILIKDKL